LLSNTGACAPLTAEQSNITKQQQHVNMFQPKHLAARAKVVQSRLDMKLEGRRGAMHVPAAMQAQHTPQ
jgi:hypothetical protein